LRKIKKPECGVSFTPWLLARAETKVTEWRVGLMAAGEGSTCGLAKHIHPLPRVAAIETA